VKTKQHALEVANAGLTQQLKDQQDLNV